MKLDVKTLGRSYGVIGGFAILVIGLITLFSCTWTQWFPDCLAQQKPKPFSTTLYKADIHGVADKEVIVSLVELSPGQAAPLHKHPGEEIVFIIDGEAIQNVDNKGEEIKLHGQVAHIPYGVVHTVRTGSKPLKAVVFRIHEKGKPERFLIDEKATKK